MLNNLSWNISKQTDSNCKNKKKNELNQVEFSTSKLLHHIWKAYCFIYLTITDSFIAHSFSSHF